MAAATTLGQDLAYALRQIRRSPGVAAVVVASLGAAMAANTSLFSVFNEFMLRPWPVADPDRVVLIRPEVSLAEWRSWEEGTTALRGLAAAGGSGKAVLSGQRVSYELVSAGYFETLGVPLYRGDRFAAAEDRGDGSGRVAIVSHRLWHEVLEGRPSAVGETIALDGVSFTVAGVAAPSFDGVRRRVDVWLPLGAWLRMRGAGERGPLRVQVAGRLAPGSTAEGARAELAVLSASFRADRGLDPVAIEVDPTDRFSGLGWWERPLFLLFVLAPSFLSLVACSNVANLLLARGTARRGEIAVRLALGAGRARLVRQLLVEAVVLALLAGALGLAGAAALPRLALSGAPLLGEVRSLSLALDGRVLAWAFSVSVVAAVVFGVGPALQCTRLSVRQALQDDHGLSSPRLKSRLLGYQVMVSVVVLVLAGLVGRSAGIFGSTEPGYSVEGLAVAELELSRTSTAEERRALAGRFFEELRTRYGESRVAVASDGPMAGPWRWVLEVSPRYFELLRIPTVAGRTFDERDPSDAVIVVNETAARRFLEDGYPVGRRLGDRGWSFTGGLEAREVVGVVRDARLTHDGPVQPLVFVPARPGADQLFLVGGPRAGQLRAIAALATRLDPTVSAEVQSGPAWLERATAGRRFFVKLLGGFGALALFLSSVGLFSVGVYGVQRRRREIGIRLALGARSRHVLGTVFSEAGRAMARGLILGGLLAAGVAFAFRHFVGLGGVHPLDPATYAGVALALLCVAAAGAGLPALRAIGTAPGDVLRRD